MKERNCFDFFKLDPTCFKQKPCLLFGDNLRRRIPQILQIRKIGNNIMTGHIPSDQSINNLKTDKIEDSYEIGPKSGIQPLGKCV